MLFYLEPSAQTGKDYYFEVEVGPNPEDFESYMKKVFAGVGLKSSDAIKAFDKFMGETYFRSMINNARNNAAVADALRDPKGKKIKITVHVYPAIVEKLRRFGIKLLTGNRGKTTFGGYAPIFEKNVKKYQNFTPVPETPVSRWTTIQKLDAVIRRAALLLPEDVGNELLKLLEPLALAIMAAVVVIWAVSHFFGVGEIADVVLLIVGIVSIGPMAWIAGEHLIKFAVGTVYAEKNEDLDAAAKHLSEAISPLGVQVVMALLLKKAPKVLNEPRVLVNKPLVKPLTFKTVGEPPTSSKFLFEKYEGTLTFLEHPFAGVGKAAGGSTNHWGDIIITYAKKTQFSEIEIAFFHERVHRFLTPRLQLFKSLRQTTAIAKKNSYLQSYILRYLEEALAQIVAQVRGNGWRSFFSSIKFPIGNESYVTLAKMGTEATGIFLGPINVGGMAYNVYYAFTVE